MDGPGPTALPKALRGYELRGRLGRGGQGSVYRALDDKGREVALKLIPLNAEVSADERRETLDRFHREALIGQKISHPSLVPVLGFGDDPDHAWIVMELVPGSTLRDAHMQARCDIDIAVGITLELLAALECLHAAGIVHRDVKPGNIIVRRSGRPPEIVVVDFGLARLEESSLTTAGRVMGTFAYMAPEVARGQTATAQSDLWAAGVILHELLTGRRLFSGTDSELIGQVLNKEIPLLADTRREAAFLDPILATALERSPHRRYRTAREFGDELRTAFQVYTTPRPLAPPRRPLRVRWLALAAGGVFGTAALAGLLLLPHPEPGPATGDGAVAREVPIERSATAEQARQEAERQAAAEQARQEAERQAAAEQARQEAERQAAAEQARQEAERQAAVERLRQEAEQQAAAERARRETERQAAVERLRPEAERAQRPPERLGTLERNQRESEQGRNYLAALEEAERALRSSRSAAGELERDRIVMSALSFGPPETKHQIAEQFLFRNFNHRLLPAANTFQHDTSWLRWLERQGNCRYSGFQGSGTIFNVDVKIIIPNSVCVIRIPHDISTTATFVGSLRSTPVRGLATLLKPELSWSYGRDGAIIIYTPLSAGWASDRFELIVGLDNQVIFFLVSN